MAKVESFTLDHTKVKAPYVRLITVEEGPKGDKISNYDLRLVQPNENAIPTAGLHTIEHLLAGLLRDRLTGVIDCSPFGCRTGFHLITWGEHSTTEVASLEVLIGRNCLPDQVGRRPRNYGKKLWELSRSLTVFCQGMVQEDSGTRHQRPAV